MAKQQVKALNETLSHIFLERQIDDIKELCSTAKGRRIIHYVLRFCGVYTGSAIFKNQNETYFNEGRRSVGLWLLDWINKADPNMHMKIEQEYWAEFISNKIKREKAMKDGANVTP